MKIIEQPLYTILTPKDELQRQLLMIEKAGRVSYQSEVGPITPATADRFIRKILTKNHESVIEHGTMAVLFQRISRGLTHELVRHRIAAFTMESTRYVDYAKEGDDIPDLDRFQMEMVFPPHKDIHQRVDLGDGRTMTPEEMANDIERFYRSLRKAGWLPEDARQVLPTGLVADIVVTANFREWRHIFNLRTAKAAHWEIRRVMGNLLEEVKVLLPPIFDDFEKAGVDKNNLPYYEIRERKTTKS